MAQRRFALINRTASGSVQLSDLSDVSSAAVTDKFVLVANGSAYIGRALLEADISDLQTYLTAEVNDLGAAVTWANIPIANVPTGTTSSTVSLGDHLHDAIVDTNLLDKSADETITGDWLVSNAAPRIDLFETGVTADNGRWQIVADTEQLVFRARTDADGVGDNFIIIDRTGTAVTDITLSTTNIALQGAVTVTSIGGITEENLLDKAAPETISGLWAHSGRLVTDDSTTTRAGLNIPTGVAPTSPVQGDVWVTATDIFARINGVSESLLGGDKTYRVGHTYGIISKIKVPSGQKDFVIPFFVSLASGQTAKLVKARHIINDGTSVTCKLQKNGSDITGFTGISVTTTAADTDPSDVTLADDDKIALVVTAVSGTPQNMSFTIFIEYTQ